MFYATSIENFNEYSNKYNANQAGESNGWAFQSDIEKAIFDEGWDQMEVADDLKATGALSVWEKGGEARVVFEVE